MRDYEGFESDMTMEKVHQSAGITSGNNAADYEQRSRSEDAIREIAALRSQLDHQKEYVLRLGDKYDKQLKELRKRMGAQDDAFKEYEVQLEQRIRALEQLDDIRQIEKKAGSPVVKEIQDNISKFRQGLEEITAYYCHLD